MRAALASGALLLAFAGQAQAATTIGSDLAATAGQGLSGVEHDYTVVQRTLPGRQLTAPIDGVIVRWRIKAGGAGAGQPVTLRVVRGTGAASTGVGSSQPEDVPATAGIYTFDTRLPIRTGDFIGIDCCYYASGHFFATTTSGAASDYWFSRLADGETRAPTGSFAWELLVNADIEPDADRDGYGDETQDQCPTDATTQGPCRVECQGVSAATMNGTDGDDTLLGTPVPDAIFGFGGNDEIDGVDGNDCLDGGDGNDILRGGAGNDLAKGADANDKLRGAGGKDKLKGGDENDRMNGGEAKDTLLGGAGTDRMRGASGKDTYKGNAGDDKLNAVDAKTDKVNCGGGDDKAVVDPIDRVSRNCETVREVERE